MAQSNAKLNYTCWNSNERCFKSSKKLDKNSYVEERTFENRKLKVHYTLRMYNGKATF